MPRWLVHTELAALKSGQTIFQVFPKPITRRPIDENGNLKASVIVDQYNPESFTFEIRRKHFVGKRVGRYHKTNYNKASNTQNFRCFYCKSYVKALESGKSLTGCWLSMHTGSPGKDLVFKTHGQALKFIKEFKLGFYPEVMMSSVDDWYIDMAFEQAFVKEGEVEGEDESENRAELIYEPSPSFITPARRREMFAQPTYLYPNKILITEEPDKVEEAPEQAARRMAIVQEREQNDLANVGHPRLDQLFEEVFTDIFTPPEEKKVFIGVDHGTGEDTRAGVVHVEKDKPL